MKDKQKWIFQFGDIVVDETESYLFVGKLKGDRMGSLLVIYRKDGNNEDQQLRARHYAERESGIVDHSITTKDGLLVLANGKVCMSTIMGDQIARSNGFQYAEQFVRHLEERGKILSWRE